MQFERDFLADSELKNKTSADEFKTFEEFLKVYEADMKIRLRENTWQSKENLLKKVTPYFKDKKLDEITKRDVMNWQNTLLALRDKNGEPYSQQYLRTIYNQFSAVMNHAVNNYDLPANPATCRCIFKKENEKEMKIWTLSQYKQFSEAIMDKNHSFCAFELLYWTGIRTGELLALVPSDFDFDNQILHITKSYQKINGKEIITAPKTHKSKRDIKMPKFLCDEMMEYIDSLYKIKITDRIFPFSKSFLRHEIARGCKKAGLEVIRTHDFRHSHVSLLINNGYTALAIAERLGHEAIDVTYRYAHLFPNAQDAMAKDLDKLKEDSDESKE